MKLVPVVVVIVNLLHTCAAGHEKPQCLSISVSVAASTLHKMLFAFSTLTASDWHVFLSCVEGEGSIVIIAFFLYQVA